MNATQRSRVVGLVLLAFALIWSVIVYQTIPAGDQGGAIGPRDFPLLLGVILAALSAILVIRPAMPAEAEDESAGGKGRAEGDKASWLEVQMAGGIFLLLILYGFLMEKFGFLIATATMSVIALAGFLGVRKPVQILIFSCSVALISWVIFGKLLGAYLPPGSWISLG